jgi:hypothetical protein
VAVDVRQLLEMSQRELDELFAASPAGEIPQGETNGTAIVAPDTHVTGAAARVARLVAWGGKVFDPDKGELVNKIGPLGLRRIRANVYRGESWFDGKECIVLDYSQTSTLARAIRDEVRQIGPTLWLGQVFWERRRVLNFALEPGGG